MTPNSAYSLINIVVGTDYSPVEQFIPHVDPNIGVTSPPGPTVSNGFNAPVYAMFCTTTNTGTTKVRLLGDSVDISFPAGSFKIGEVYYVYLKKLVDDGGGTFIGYKYQFNPFVL